MSHTEMLHTRRRKKKCQEGTRKGSQTSKKAEEAEHGRGSQYRGTEIKELPGQIRGFANPATHKPALIARKGDVLINQASPRVPRGKTSGNETRQIRGKLLSSTAFGLAASPADTPPAICPGYASSVPFSTASSAAIATS